MIISLAQMLLDCPKWDKAADLTETWFPHIETAENKIGYQEDLAKILEVCKNKIGCTVSMNSLIKEAGTSRYYANKIQHKLLQEGIMEQLPMSSRKVDVITPKVYYRILK